MIRVWCCKPMHLIQILFIIAIGTAEALPSDFLDGTVVNIAHRGGIIEGYPENTLAALSEKDTLILYRPDIRLNCDKNNYRLFQNYSAYQNWVIDQIVNNFS